MKKDKIYYPNYDDYKETFWDRNFRISLTAQGIEFIVNADHEGDALDYVIDYCEENLGGLIMSAVEESEEEYLEEFISGGNNERYLNTLNIYIEEI